MSLIPFAGAVQKFNRQRDTQYQIERSLRFNSADSAYLNRTPASAGNRKTWTISLWFKRTAFGSLTKMFSAGAPSGAFTFLETVTDNTFKFGHFNGTTTDWSIQTTQVFRDPSAWMHIILAVDTTQATNTNRIKLYINGSQVTALTATYPSQNTDTDFNNTVAHQIGNGVYNSTEPFNGYMAEFYLIDGSALDPTSFGEFNSDTGVWQPKAYTGSYGTNGFYLNFSDNSGVTSTTLGADSSGNGNNWTPNNFSVTAGAGNDSLVDTPTPYGTDTGVGGEVRGNYATLNPLDVRNGTFSNGNLNGTASAGDNGENVLVATIAMTSGKWYCEVLVGSGGAHMIGIADSSKALSTRSWQGANGWYYHVNGEKYNAGGGTAYGATYTANDIIGVAYDADVGSLSFYKNGVSQGVAFNSGLVGKPMVFALGSGTNSFAQVFDCNFGQRPFAYTAPSGFKALCTQNLPEPTIVDGGEYFNTVLYTGNNSNGNAITGVGFSPDFIWFKSRSASNGHCLVNRITGVSAGLGSDSTAAEQNPNLASFDADGFTVNSVVDFSSTNANGNSIVAWNWKANGTGVSNTAGTITSTVSANTDSGFSIVTASASGTSPVTIGHGLGVQPKLIIGKVRDVASTNWYVYSASIAASDYLVLNSTAAKATSSNIWDTAPTSTVFTVGNPQNGWAGGNSGTKTYVFYCFAPVAGYSAFGSYVGNGSTDGPFVYTGFRPAYVMVKASSFSTSSTVWALFDTSRSPYNAAVNELYANLSSAEGVDSSGIDILSNGFKPKRNSEYANFSGQTYIYMAFAENPFKYALAR